MSWLLLLFFLWELIIFIDLQELFPLQFWTIIKILGLNKGKIFGRLPVKLPVLHIFHIFSVIYSITIVTCIKFFTPANDKNPTFQFFGIHVFKKSLGQNSPLTPSLHCLNQESRCLCVYLNSALRFLKFLN